MRSSTSVSRAPGAHSATPTRVSPPPSSSTPRPPAAHQISRTQARRAPGGLARPLLRQRHQLAVALLELTDHLNHRTYNVASGHATPNAEVAAAIRQAVPDAQVDLPSGGDTRQAWLDVTRLRQDTGYEPVWDTKHAAADYIAWLQADNER